MGSQDRHQRETPDDLDVLLAALPPEIVAAIDALPDRESLIEVVLDLGRRPEARYPSSRGRRCSSARSPRPTSPYVVEHIGTFGDDNRAGIERTLHRISAIRNRSGKIVGLTCRIGRAVYGTIEIIADFVETGKSILIMGRPGHRQDDDAPRGRPRARRRAAQARRRRRHLERDRRRRRHPAPGHRQGAPDAGAHARAPARGDDRGGREPHARGHRHRRDRDGARGAGRPHDRRARRAADRHGARQQPRQPDAQPHPVRPDRRDPERDAGRRGGAPPRARRRASSSARQPPTFDVIVEIQDRERCSSTRTSRQTVDAMLLGDPVAPELRWRDEEGVHRSQSRPKPSAREVGWPAATGSPGSPARAQAGRGAASPAGAARPRTAPAGTPARTGCPARPGYRPGQSGGWRGAPRGSDRGGERRGTRPGGRPIGADGA